MTTVADLKRFLLRALHAASGLPIRQPQLERMCQDAFTPRPLMSDIHEAIQGLEFAGFISGATDDLDKLLSTWALTEKGKHKVKNL
jgi:hypothetical protein